MPYTPAGDRATRKYKSTNMSNVSIALNHKYDTDIISRLEAVGNKQGYIKRLIREDIARHPEPEPEP